MTETARPTLPTLHEIDNEITRLSPMAGTFPFAKDALTAWQWLRFARLLMTTIEVERDIARQEAQEK